MNAETEILGKQGTKRKIRATCRHTLSLFLEDMKRRSEAVLGAESKQQPKTYRGNSYHTYSQSFVFTSKEHFSFDSMII